MAKFETLKLVDALKVNKKTGVQMTQRCEIPFGAIIENPHEVRGFLRFAYLGEMYDVKYSDIEGYFKLIGGQPPSPSPSIASPPAAVVDSAPVSDSPPSSPAPAGADLRFQAVKSNVPISRARIPGGWLVVAGQGLTFVPDAGHDWDGKSVDQ